MSSTSPQTAQRIPNSPLRGEFGSVSPAVSRRLAQIPDLYRATYLKALSGSKTAAVKAQCLECVGWQRAEVTRCTDDGCPLFNVRPYQKKSPRRGESPGACNARSCDRGTSDK